MSLPMTRTEAYELVLDKIGTGNLLKHILSVEAGMRAVATHLNADIDYWGMVGLLHDLDYHATADDESRHTYVAREWLVDRGFDDGFWHAIHAHPGHVDCQSPLDWALFAVDPTTGFLTAAALLHPSRALDGPDQTFLLKRFKDKRFARGATRANIAACSELGLELPAFLMLVQSGMLTIRDQLQL